MKHELKLIKIKQKTFTNPIRRLVQGSVFLDGTGFEFAGWVYQQNSGRFRFGRQEDSEKFRTLRFHCIRFWTGKKDVQASDVQKQIIKDFIETICMSAIGEINLNPNHKGEEQMSKKKAVKKDQESTPEMMSRLAVPTIDVPPVPSEVIHATLKSPEEAKLQPMTAEPQKSVTESLSLCQAKVGPGFNRVCGKPVLEKGQKFCGRHEPVQRILKAKSHRASEENIINALVAAGYGTKEEVSAMVRPYYQQKS